jgi:hypothetical protein
MVTVRIHHKGTKDTKTTKKGGTEMWEERLKDEG